jgi:cell division septum initiation protein DivIVA
MQPTRRTKAKEYSRRAKVAGTCAKKVANKAKEIADDVLSEAGRAEDAFQAALKALALQDVVFTATVS